MSAPAAASIDENYKKLIDRELKNRNDRTHALKFLSLLAPYIIDASKVEEEDASAEASSSSTSSTLLRKLTRVSVSVKSSGVAVDGEDEAPMDSVAAASGRGQPASTFQVRCINIDGGVAGIDYVEMLTSIRRSLRQHFHSLHFYMHERDRHALCVSATLFMDKTSHRDRRVDRFEPGCNKELVTLPATAQALPESSVKRQVVVEVIDHVMCIEDVVPDIQVQYDDAHNVLEFRNFDSLSFAFLEWLLTESKCVHTVTNAWVVKYEDAQSLGLRLELYIK